MEKDNVIELVQPGEFKDKLTEVLRQGAQALVLQAVEAEFAAFLESHSAEITTRWPQACCAIWAPSRKEGGDGYWGHPCQGSSSTG